jgi:type II secretory pathway component PulK
MEGPQQPGQAGEEEEAQQAFASTGELINVPSLSDEDIQAIWDLVTAESAGVIEGRININTAPQEVLASLIDADLAQEIIEYRTSRGPLPTVAHLLSVDPSVRANFVELANLLTTRSYVFTIEATGRAGRDEITHRIRAVVDLSGDEPNYLMICHY